MNDECAICGDTGWALLNTHTQLGQTNYEDGTAPCHWCIEGQRRALQHPTLRSDYTLADVVPYTPSASRHESRAAYEQAKADIARILARHNPHTMPKPLHSARDQATPEELATIAREVEAGKAALRQAQNEAATPGTIRSMRDDT